MCEYDDCTAAGTEGLVLDAFSPTKVLCSDHAAAVKASLMQHSLLQQMWWPPKGSVNTSRRHEYGMDWKPLAR